MSFTFNMTSHCYKSIILFAITASCLVAHAFQNDGPYIRYQGQSQGQGLEATWICDGKVVNKIYPQAAGAIVEPMCGLNQAIHIQETIKTFPVATQFSAKKLAAMSDVHGQYQTMLQLLQNNGIINEDLNWIFGDGHLVITGDIFDRGDSVNQALWLLYKLDAQANQAGGALHLLLGNHETMVMANDVRYVNKQYFKTTKLLGKTYPELYDNSSILGRWLRSKPVIIQVNDSLFMHGGLHPDISKLQLSIPEINEQFRNSLGMAKAEIKAQEVLAFLYGSTGPIWYRGYFNTPKVDNAALDTLLEKLKVKRVIVGHTTMSGIFSHLEGRVFSIDSDIKSKKGEILLFENGLFSRGSLQGERSPIPKFPSQEN